MIINDVLKTWTNKHWIIWESSNHARDFFRINMLCLDFVYTCCRALTWQVLAVTSEGGLLNYQKLSACAARNWMTLTFSFLGGMNWSAAHQMHAQTVELLYFVLSFQCVCLWWWSYGEIFFFIVKVSLMNFFIFYSSHQRERESPPLNLFTCVLGDDFFARVTANTAAPLELAITLLLNNNLLCIVASAAAEQWAAVESCRCLAAFSAMRACNHRVFLVEVWKGWRKSWRDVKHSPVHCSCLFTLHQSGDSSRYTKSNAVGTLKRESLTCKRPRLFILTCVACSYFSRRKSPETSSKFWMELRNTTTDREWDCSRFFTRRFGFCSRNTKLTYFSNCT